MNNLTYKVVNIDEDYPMIASWYEANKLPAPPKDWFEPGYGIIVSNVAAIFLYCTKNRAYIEDMISNPESDKEERNVVLSTISNMLEEEAIKRGIKYIIFCSSHPAVIDRAIKHNYKVVRGKFYLIMKMLTGDK